VETGTDSRETEVAFAGIARQAEMLAAGEISSVELLDLCLERIERLNPRLNAFTQELHESARAAAVEADRRLAAGERAPMLGVPIALKDELDDVEGLITTNGTAGYDRPAPADAEHTRRLRAAGALIVAKTTLPELAIVGFTESKTYGITRNPWDQGRTTGGSSGGSAAAVAAGLFGAASASDGAGSIRIPAANCGLFGLKTQRGRISLAPLR
jgi:amidase